MMGYKYNNYFENVTTYLRKSSRSRIEITSKNGIKHIMMFVRLVVMIGSMVVYAADTYLQYSKTVEVKGYNITDNDRQNFRKSMFGYQSLFAIDVVIKIYAMIVSSMCLFIYTCANTASCEQLTEFNKQLKDKIADKSIMKLEIIRTLESQLTDFLTLIKFVTENARGIIVISFVSGVMTFVSSMYAVKAFDEYLSIGKFTFGLWIGVAVFFLIYSTEEVGVFHVSLRETSDLLNLSHEVQKEVLDKDIQKIVKDMINRINTFDYGSKNMFPVSSGMALFNTLVLLIPFVIDFFVRLKYVPPFLISTTETHG
ncbi:hypothetical protein FO519_001628 [Halicephalobus sp. NKZ332]|nr:hypothetical protein FO519_001628 [Halicephalobus sp. NKZ332]